MADELPEFEKSPNCPYLFKTILLKNKIRGVLVTIKDDLDEIDDDIDRETGERISVQQFNKAYLEDPANRCSYKLTHGNDLSKYVRKQENCQKRKVQKDNSSEDFVGVVCLNVGVGDTSDPGDSNGLAHLTEHCVYLGSDKFPKPGEAIEQMKNIHGEANASTMPFNTDYFILCPAKSKFEGAVARLADMFISPKFIAERVLNERHAVDGEFYMRERRHTIGLLQILRTLTNPSHPMHRFGCGNLETLSENPDLVGQMKKFHRDFYIGKLTTLTMVSTLPIETLEEMVIKYLGDIREGEQVYPPLTWKKDTKIVEPCSSQFESFTKILSHKHHSNLIVNFSLSPKFWKAFGSKPLRYVNNLLRNRSVGGLRHYLITEGYSYDFYAGPLEYEFCHTEFYSFYNILVVLSQKGFQNYEHVLEAVFAYIRVLQEKGAQESYFNEIQKYHQIKFHYNYQTNHTFARRPKEQAAEYCFFMHGVPPWKILTSKHLLSHFDKDLTNEVLKALQPEKANYMLSSRTYGVIVDKIEPFYRTKYHREQPIPEGLMNKMRNSTHKFGFQMPRPNPYLNLKIGKLFSDKPKHILPQAITKIKLKSQKRDKAIILRGNMVVPKNGHLAKVKCAIFFRTEMYRKWNAKYLNIICDFMSYLLEIVLNSNLKPSSGSTVNVNAGFTATPHNVVIYIHCPSQLLEIVFKDVLKIFFEFQRYITKDQFEAKKERIVGLELESWDDDTHISIEEFIFCSTNYSFSLFRARIRSLTYEEFLKRIDEYQKEMFLTITLEGCVQKHQVKAMKRIIEPLNYYPMDIYAKSIYGIALPPRTCKLPLGERALRIFSNLPYSKTTVVKNYYQFDQTIEEKLVEEMACILSRELFYDIRTNQQLGYIAKVQSFSRGGVPFLFVYIVTRAKYYTSGYICQQIDQFWTTMHCKFFSCQEAYKVFANRYLKDPPSYVQLKDIFERYLLRTGSNFRLFSVQIISPFKDKKWKPKDCSDKKKQMGKYSKMKPCLPVEFVKYSTSKKAEKNKNEDTDQYFIHDIDDFKDSLRKFSMEDQDGDEDKLDPFLGAEGDTSDEEETDP